MLFDFNDEYTNLGLNEDGGRNKYYNKIKYLDPYSNEISDNTYPLKISLSDIDPDTLCNSLRISETTQMFPVIQTFYFDNKDKDYFGLDDLQASINNDTELNIKTRQALQYRIERANKRGLYGESKVTECIESLPEGGLIVINLQKIAPFERKSISKTFLKMVQRMMKGHLDPFVMILEEAQNYMDDNDFRDLITRIRHIGIYLIFVTNDPTHLKQEVYTNLDNLFVFNFKSDKIIDHLALSGIIDVDTLNNAKNLQKGECLAIGKLTHNYPLFLKIESIDDIQMAGETKKLHSSRD